MRSILFTDIELYLIDFTTIASSEMDGTQTPSISENWIDNPLLLHNNNSHAPKKKALAFSKLTTKSIQPKASPAVILRPIHAWSESLKYAPTVPHSENVVLLPAFKKRCH